MPGGVEQTPYPLLSAGRDGSGFDTSTIVGVNLIHTTSDDGLRLRSHECKAGSIYPSSSKEPAKPVPGTESTQQAGTRVTRNDRLRPFDPFRFGPSLLGEITANR